MSKQKEVHLSLLFPTRQAEQFRAFVQKFNQRDEKYDIRYYKAFKVEIIEVFDKGSVVEFGLWVDRPAAAFWFALDLEEAKEKWYQLESEQKGGPQP